MQNHSSTKSDASGQRDELLQARHSNSTHRIMTFMGMGVLPLFGAKAIWTLAPAIASEFKVAAIAILSVGIIAAGRYLLNRLSIKDKSINIKLERFPEPTKPLDKSSARRSARSGYTAS